jgi:hypothetical protein
MALGYWPSWFRRDELVMEDTRVITMRRAGATSAATLIGLTLTVVLVQAVAPEWLQRVGLDVWNYPAALAASQSANQDAAMIDEQKEQLFQEFELSDHVCNQLVAGELSLTAAVDEMEPIMRHRAGFDYALRVWSSNLSFRQGVARYLIRRITRVNSAQPQHLSMTQARLECEYARIK